MTRTQTLKAGETTRIIHRVAHNLPQSFSFTAQATDGAPVQGEIKVQGSSGPFPKAATTQPLKATNTVSKGVRDTFYSVYATPAQDTEITLDTVKGGTLFIRVVIGLVVLAVAASVLLPLLLP